MGPYKAGQIVRNMKSSVFPLLMGIFVIRLFTRKGNMLTMQYIKFRKRTAFQKYGTPFLERPLLRRSL